MAGHPIFAALDDRMLARAERRGLGATRVELVGGAGGLVLSDG
jgi:hypothetical protein